MIKSIIAVIFIFISISMFGQNDNYIRLYANMGMQINQSNSFFNTNLKSNTYPFQIGAGSSYKLGQFILGTEFYNSTGKLENTNHKLDYKEFTTTLYLGYDLSKSNNFAIEPNIGFTMSNKQSILYDYQNINSQVYQINQLGVSPSLTITKFNEAGISIGMKIGCNYTLNNHTWNEAIDESSTNNSIKKVTPFIQLNFGGRIKLFKKKKKSPKEIELSNNQNFNETEKMNEIDTILTHQIKENKTPSVQYVIFNKDSIIHKFKAGLADINNKREITDNTTYNTYSVTKTFTALSILQLAERGKIDIEKPVINYLPQFPYSSKITIRELLSHSGGIPSPIPLNWIHLTNEYESFNRDNFFNQVFLKNNKTKSNPNEKYSYSNLGYVLLGQLIEKVSKVSYEEYINTNILKPLGIKKSEMDFIIINDTNHAKGYHKKHSFSNVILSFMIDKQKFVDTTEGKWNSFHNFYINGVSYGGLIGTSNVLVKYIQELLKPNCKLITDEYKKMLFTENITNKGKQTEMCLSWFSGLLDGNKYFTHAGGGGGYYCEIRIYPKRGIGSVVMFNRTGMSDERFLDRLDKYILNE